MMQRATATSVCSSCLRATGSRPALSSLGSMQPWLSQRTLTRQIKPKPSRMVLADQVYRTPRSKGRPAGERERLAGPFGGMNKTVANVDRKRQAPSSRASAASGGKEARRDSKRRPEERKALKMQRALATVSYGKRASVKESMAEYESFDQFDLSPTLKSAVTDELFKNLVAIKPTPVQRLAIPALLGKPSPDESTSEPKKQQYLLAAETGSGKTLAYLLPAINALKIAEANDPEIQAYNERYQAEKKRLEESGGKGRPLNEPHPTMARPKVVVLVPTAELVQQVGGVSKTISHVVKFKTEMLSSDLRAQHIQRNMNSPRGVDVIISTPHLLASMVDSNPNILSQVSHLIVDEADSLLDRGFAPVTTSIIDRAMPSLKQLVCCSATIPRHMNNLLAVNYPNMVRITTPNLHAIPRRVQLGVLDVSREPFRNNKDLACADAIYSIGREGQQHEGPVKDEIDVRRILVFVNEREKAEEVAAYLRTKGIDAQALHRDTVAKRHGEVLEAFTTSEPLKTPLPTTRPRHGRIHNVKVLVVTDLASRGIDTLAVRHVILYDVPHTTIDFIHRLGRAGRMGRRGRGIVLVGNDDRKDVVADVKKSMFMGQALI